MKALYFQEHGDLDVIQYGEVQAPTPGPREVIVKVRACAINYLDIWVRRGWPGLTLEMPHWCGADVAGEFFPERLAGGLEKTASREMVLGVRPDDLSLAADGPDAPGSFEARVEVVEPMGNEITAYLSVGEHDVVARLPADTQPEQQRRHQGLQQRGQERDRGG